MHNDPEEYEAIPEWIDRLSFRLGVFFITTTLLYLTIHIVAWGFHG